MSHFPGAVLHHPILQFFDENGDPLDGGKLFSYIAGTSTPQALYTDASLTTPYSNPIILDSSGRAPGPIYLLPTGYKFTLKTSADVVVMPWPADDIADVGQVFAETLGLELASGSLNQTSGYTVLVTDRLVTMSSTGGPSPCVVNLPPAANATQPVTIKNVGTIALAVTPNGTNTIDTVNAAYTVPAGSSPTFPSVLLVSDGVSSWYILASHKV